MLPAFLCETRILCLELYLKYALDRLSVDSLHYLYKNGGML